MSARWSPSFSLGPSCHSNNNNDDNNNNNNNNNNTKKKNMSAVQLTWPGESWCVWTTEQAQTCLTSKRAQRLISCTLGRKLLSCDDLMTDVTSVVTDSVNNNISKEDVIHEAVSYDSDQEPLESNDHLHWRLDPEISLSDWVIVIRYKKSGTEQNERKDSENTAVAVDEPAVLLPDYSSATHDSAILEETYYVHKHILAVGPRRSNYFSDLFSQHANRSVSTEQHPAVTVFDLEEIAAAAVPAMLDFLYSPMMPLHVTTHNATALHWLGQYFDIQRLRFEAKRFIQTDLTTASCGLYYEHARFLRDERMMKSVSKYCIQHIEFIRPSSRLVRVPEPELWLRILRHYTITREFSRHMSKLLAEFCVYTKVKKEMFEQLTEERYLPTIDGNAALTLLDLERQIVSPDADNLSSLQKRCIRALVRNWDTAELTNERAMDVLERQSSLVLTTILTQSIRFARLEKERRQKATVQTNLLQFARWKLMPTLTDSLLRPGKPRISSGR